MKKFTIKFDATEELEGAMLRETDISSVDALAEQANTGDVSVHTLAVDTAVLEEFEQKPESERIVKPPKAAWKVGVSNILRAKINSRTAPQKMPNGKEVEVPVDIGVPGAKPYTKSEEVVVMEKTAGEEKPEEPQHKPEPGYVKAVSDDGLRRARLHLESVVIGHIRNKFVIIGACGEAEDVTESAEKLKDKIDEIVREIVE